MLANITQYPSFITFISIAFSLAISLILMPIWKRILKKKSIGQQVRIEGPETHFVKQGTPTMGGVVILLSLIVCIFFIGYVVDYNIAVLSATIAAGILGFIDDSAKVIFKRSLGLGPKTKLFFQFTIAIVFILYAVNELNITPTVIIPFIVNIDLGFLSTYIPIFGGIYVPWFYLIFVSLLLVGMCNACNLADGLDGLAAGCSIIIMVVMTAIAYKADSLSCCVVSGSLAGACIGFLWHNTHPADIFMGDTGSLALGMALGCLAVLTKSEFVVLIIGGLYIIEALSVMLQVFYFKLKHKRIFLMAPLHHHFEKKGWSETKVVVRFWIISGIFASIGFAIQILYMILHW